MILSRKSELNSDLWSGKDHVTPCASILLVQINLCLRDVASISKEYIFIHQNLIFHQSVSLSMNPASPCGSSSSSMLEEINVQYLKELQVNTLHYNNNNFNNNNTIINNNNYIRNYKTN